MSRWISVDPPLIRGAYLGNDLSKLPGMGGVFNPINLDAYQYGGMNPVKYVDPDGNELYLSGLDGDQRFQLFAATMYISQSKRGKELMSNVSKPVKDGGMMFSVAFNSVGRNEYDPETQTIHWDPSIGLEVWYDKNGGYENGRGKQSPALILAHEFGHADQHTKGRGAELILVKRTGAGRPKLERDNLYTTEIPIAEQLNSGYNRSRSMKEGIRRNYLDVIDLYKAKNTGSNEKKK